MLAKYSTNLILCSYRFKHSFKRNSIFEEMRLNAYSIRTMPNLSEEIIMKDDLKQIQDISLSISVTKFHPFMNMNVSLAYLSDFYGSEKYLISNNTNIEKASLYDFAGGNQLIIDKLEGKCNFEDEQLNIAILFRRNSLASKYESKRIRRISTTLYHILIMQNLCPTILIIKNGFLISIKH